jgi:hypothetical protein
MTADQSCPPQKVLSVTSSHTLCQLWVKGQTDFDSALEPTGDLSSRNSPLPNLSYRAPALRPKRPKSKYQCHLSTALDKSLHRPRLSALTCRGGQMKG